MPNDNLSENGVNEAGTDRGFAPGSCSVRTQAGFGRHPMTTRKKWTKEVNKLVMKCFCNVQENVQENLDERRTNCFETA